MKHLAVYCVDVGSVKRGNFGWARADAAHAEETETHRGGVEIFDLVDSLTMDLKEGTPVALGWECPLFVPVPTNALDLGAARAGDGNRAWSAAAGTAALATGLAQSAWLLRAVRQRRPLDSLTLDWSTFSQGETGLYLWEAFVSAAAKGTTHVDDARLAVAAFCAALPDPMKHNSVQTDSPLSLIGASALWAGWSPDTKLLTTPCLVINAMTPVRHNPTV